MIKSPQLSKILSVRRTVTTVISCVKTPCKLPQFQTIKLQLPLHRGMRLMKKTQLIGKDTQRQTSDKNSVSKQKDHHSSFGEIMCEKLLNGEELKLII